jgi:ABC-type phosphate transport system auxiliary subunit
MGYCCIGNMSQADWAEIKKLCSAMRKEFNKKLDDLDTKLEGEIQELSVGEIQTIKNQLQALAIQVNALVTGQEVQDNRLNELEEKCANLEITTSEVLEAYNGA